MQPASVGLAAAIARVPFSDASVPVISNISAQPLRTSVEFQQELAAQIISPVQWTKTVEFLAAEGVATFVEIGSGQVLAGLIKRIAKGATVFSLGAAADVERVGIEMLARAVG
jgi:[acyl-carrier-protein] S-malonyltransferase